MLNDASLNTRADAWAAAYPYLSIHTDATESSSGAESTAARQLAGWSAAVAGDVTATNVAFTGGASSGPALRVGYWSAVTGGTFGGSEAIPGGQDQSFNAAGELTVTSLTVNGTAV